MHKTQLVLSLLALSTLCIHAKQININDILNNIQSNPTQVNIDLLEQRKATVDENRIVLQHSLKMTGMCALLSIAGAYSLYTAGYSKYTSFSFTLGALALAAIQSSIRLLMLAPSYYKNMEQYNSEINAIEKTLEILIQK